MIFPNIARQYCADLLFHKLTFNRDLYLALFQTRYTVTSAMTLSSVLECNFSGYSRIQLAQTSSWLRGPIDSNGMYPWVLPTPVSFICNGGGVTNNVYGVMLLCTQQDTLQAGPPTSISRWCRQFTQCANLYVRCWQYYQCSTYSPSWPVLRKLDQ